MMKSFKSFLLGLALIAGAANLNAQENSSKTPKERAEMHTQKMTKALSLTEDQMSKVAEVNLGIAIKNDAVRNAENMTKEQKKEALKANHEAKMRMMKSILTEEQFKKFEEMEAQKAEKKKASKKKKTSEKELEEL